MMRLRVKEYSEATYVKLVKKWFEKQGVSSNRVLYNDRTRAIKRARILWRTGAAGGRKPAVWAGAIIRITVSPEKYYLKDIADFYDVTEVAVRNTARAMRQHVQ